MRRILTTILLSLLVQCRNPFLPSTGEPIQFPATGQRSTPQGLIDQLVESYEFMRIDLFKDLLPADGSFRFFVAPGFLKVYRDKYQQLSEVRDERLQFIGQSEYWFYWTQKQEVEKHTLMFTRSLGINFVSKPALESVRPFVDKGDSLAELLVTGGQFIFSYPQGDTILQYPVSVEKQVFLIKKDLENLWVILKWYDFSTGE